MKIKNNKYYKIRHIPTRLFKSEGQNGRFTKEGKIWVGSRLKNHLRLFENYSVRKDLITLAEAIDDAWSSDAWSSDRMGFTPKYHIKDCEIVEIKMFEMVTQDLTKFIEQEMTNG